MKAYFGNLLQKKHAYAHKHQGKYDTKYTKNWNSLILKTNKL